jgi:hypothetical protein
VVAVEFINKPPNEINNQFFSFWRYFSIATLLVRILFPFKATCIAGLQTLSVFFTAFGSFGFKALLVRFWLALGVLGAVTLSKERFLHLIYRK